MGEETYSSLVKIIAISIIDFSEFTKIHAASLTEKAGLPVSPNFATNTIYGGKFLSPLLVGMWRAQWVSHQKKAYTQQK